GLFVINFQHRHRQYGSPMIHHPPVAPKSRGNLLVVVRPVNFFETRQPTGNGHVAQVAAAMNESRAGKEASEKPKEQIILQPLVDDAKRRAAESAKPLQVAR